MLTNDQSVLPVAKGPWLIPETAAEGSSGNAHVDWFSFDFGVSAFCSSPNYLARKSSFFTQISEGHPQKIRAAENVLLGAHKPLKTGGFMR